MTVSILLPVYNTKLEYLKQCLVSIKNQDFKKTLEVVVVNDGSNLQTRIELTKLIAEMNTKKKNIKFVLYNLEENKGLPHALNYGLEKCTYELVARMDSDDIMLPWRIRKQYNYMKTHPKCDVLGGQMILIDEDKKFTRFTRHPLKINNQLVKKSNHFINHPSVMYKKSIIINCGGYSENLKGHAEDLYLWIQLIKKGYIFKNLPDCLIIYRILNSSLSHNFKKNIQRDFKEWKRGLSDKKIINVINYIYGSLIIIYNIRNFSFKKIGFTLFGIYICNKYLFIYIYLNNIFTIINYKTYF